MEVQRIDSTNVETYYRTEAHVLYRANLRFLKWDYANPIRGITHPYLSLSVPKETRIQGW